MQLVCEPEQEGRVAVGSSVWVPGEVVVGGDGTVTMLPGAWIGTTNEARRRPRPRPAPQPPAERRTPMPPSVSPVWQEAERYRGPVRRNDRGEYLMWDYTH